LINANELFQRPPLCSSLLQHYDAKIKRWSQVNWKIDITNVAVVRESLKSISSPQNDRHPVIMNLLKIDFLELSNHI